MSPELLPPVIATAVVVTLLILGALRVAAGYRTCRRTLRRWSHTRLAVTQQPRKRKTAAKKKAKGGRR